MIRSGKFVKKKLSRRNQCSPDVTVRALSLNGEDRGEEGGRDGKKKQGLR